MKLLRMKVSGLKLFSDCVDINFMAQQRVDSNNTEGLYNLFSNIYINNTIAFLGINASGKTTTLKLIAFLLEMVTKNVPINNISSREVLIGDEFIFESYFISNSKKIIKLQTIISKKDDSQDFKYFITHEKLWEKDKKEVKTKKTLFDFTEAHFIETRDNNDLYLLEDVSMIVAYNKRNNNKTFVKDYTQFTNFNFITEYGDIPTEIITYLDSSIEYFKVEFAKNEDIYKINLKFKNNNEIIRLNHPLDIEQYLSSGTIKGINVFLNIKKALSNGGYVVIDELENHFNKEIVSTILRFYSNKKINSMGAILIFSTHYSELLDGFERNDNVFIIRKDNKIKVDNLSKLLNRNDIKKSEIYQSDFLNGTAPSYTEYINLKKIFESNNNSYGEV
ncbi:MAG: ATP/GTP-binding protein [Aminipila sp.]